MNEPALAEGPDLREREIRFWRLGVVALILALCTMLLQGCSTLIAETGRFGPDPDWSFRGDQTLSRLSWSGCGANARRLELNASLMGNSAPSPSTQSAKGRWPRESDRGLLLGADVCTLFAAELSLVPLTYFQKDKRTYEHRRPKRNQFIGKTLSRLEN
jgi:hypothetical protein